MRLFLLVVAIFASILAVGNGFAQTGSTPAEVKTISVEALQADLDNPELRIIDVRRSGDYDSSDTKIKGAARRDPKAVSTWIQQYSKSDRIVLYCA